MWNWCVEFIIKLVADSSPPPYYLCWLCSGGDDDTLLTTWRNLGRFLKSSCNETDVYVLSGNSNVTHAMHMKADKRWAVTVGGVDCRIMHYYVLPPKARPAAETIPEAAAHTTG